jgi:hypothetical protein
MTVGGVRHDEGEEQSRLEPRKAGLETPSSPALPGEPSVWLPPIQFEALFGVSSEKLVSIPFAEKKS